MTTDEAPFLLRVTWKPDKRGEGYPDARIYEVGESGVRRAAYETLEHVAVTRRFVSDRAAYLKSILG